mmetsp:Transcript_125652/g.391250  ORF Transcript_125652/g.391250 Transcript_125652/m.391250 type:complete len:379 (-) Transcript_125652:616-1752(-)
MGVAVLLRERQRPLSLSQSVCRSVEPDVDLAQRLPCLQLHVVITHGPAGHDHLARPPHRLLVVLKVSVKLHEKVQSERLPARVADPPVLVQALLRDLLALLVLALEALQADYAQAAVRRPALLAQLQVQLPLLFLEVLAGLQVHLIDALRCVDPGGVYLVELAQAQGLALLVPDLPGELHGVDGIVGGLLPSRHVVTHVGDGEQVLELHALVLDLMHDARGAIHDFHGLFELARNVQRAGLQQESGAQRARVLLLLAALDKGTCHALRCLDVPAPQVRLHECIHRFRLAEAVRGQLLVDAQRLLRVPHAVAAGAPLRHVNFREGHRCEGLEVLLVRGLEELVGVLQHADAVEDLVVAHQRKTAHGLRLGHGLGVRAAL